MSDTYLGLSTKTSSGRRKEHFFCLTSITWRAERKGSIRAWGADEHVRTESTGRHLLYVLAEGWDCGELGDEVEVGSGEGVNSTAVINRKSFVCGQSQVLCGMERNSRNKLTEAIGIQSVYVLVVFILQILKNRRFYYFYFMLQTKENGPSFY